VRVGLLAGFEHARQEASRYASRCRLCIARGVAVYAKRNRRIGVAKARANCRYWDASLQR
jgi:hypothetical protein